MTAAQTIGALGAATSRPQAAARIAGSTSGSPGGEPPFAAALNGAKKPSDNGAPPGAQAPSATGQPAAPGNGTLPEPWATPASSFSTPQLAYGEIGAEPERRAEAPRGDASAENTSLIAPLPSAPTGASPARLSTMGSSSLEAPSAAVPRDGASTKSPLPSPSNQNPEARLSNRLTTLELSASPSGTSVGAQVEALRPSLGTPTDNRTAQGQTAALSASTANVAEESILERAVAPRGINPLDSQEPEPPRAAQQAQPTSSASAGSGNDTTSPAGSGLNRSQTAGAEARIAAQVGATEASALTPQPRNAGAAPEGVGASAEQDAPILNASARPKPGESAGTPPSADATVVNTGANDDRLGRQGTEPSRASLASAAAIGSAAVEPAQRKPVNLARSQPLAPAVGGSAPAVSDAEPLLPSPALPQTPAIGITSAASTPDDFRGDRGTSQSSSDGAPNFLAPQNQSASPAPSRASFETTFAAAQQRAPMIEAMHVHRLSDGRIEVQLDPPELGRVEISFEFSDDGLRASLASERAGTAELVRRHAEMLLQQLRAAGFENATLDFGERAERHPPPERRGVEAKAAPSGSLTTDLLPDMRVETAQKGLDLRL